VIDRTGLQLTDKAVDALSDAAVGAGASLSPAAVKKLVDVLAPRLSLVRSLAATISDEGAALVRLTEEQFAVLEILCDFPRVGVSGGAGTGKTLVAMERARRLAAEGRRVLLICYNRGLPAISDRARTGSRCPRSTRCATTSRVGLVSSGLNDRRAPTASGSGATRRRRCFSRRSIAGLTSGSTPSSWTRARTSTSTGGSGREAPASAEGRRVVAALRSAPEHLDAVRRALHRIFVESRLPLECLVGLFTHSSRTSDVCQARTFGNPRHTTSRAAPGEVQFTTLQGFNGLRPMQSSCVR
jgi:hypothetical protein